MKRKLIVRPQARLDRVKHSLYFYEHQPSLVQRFDKSVQDAIKRIAGNPRGGPTLSLESFAEVELRFRHPHGFENHLVIYQVTDDAVIVLRILHGSQDIEAALRQ